VVGGHSKAAARRAGRYGDGFYPLGVTPDRLAVLRKVMSESAVVHGRDPAAIELTLLGGADLASADALAELGAHRMIIAAHERDAASLRRVLEGFRKNVMERS
jgi:alkanesulfonate monooxygenase SsuD/methylene tetrahydromethanopterin reductase-like flavin-dependent oxidoreductase (luciferase family)